MLLLRAKQHLGNVQRGLRNSSFSQISRKFIGHSKSRPIALFGVCVDVNSSYLRGPAKAPAKIKAQLACPSANDYCELGENVVENLDILDDVVPSGGEHERVCEAIAPVIDNICRRGQVPLVLGGDHSITFPVCKSLRRHRDRPFKIVHFDAHPDLYEDFEGNPSSHASPFARILETGRNSGTSGSSNSQDFIICSKLISIGIRTMNPPQRAVVNKYNVSVVEARHFPPSLAFPDLSSMYKDICRDDDVYISVDIDSLDPAFAPGVSHWEPGGLATRQLISAIHSIPGNIIGADVVELNPDRDPQSLTATVAAKITREIAGLIIHKKEGN